MWPAILEAGVGILVGLAGGEQDAENDGQQEPPLQTAAIVVQQRVVGPGDRGAGGQQDQRVDQRQAPGSKVPWKASLAFGGQCPPVSALRSTMP